MRIISRNPRAKRGLSGGRSSFFCVLFAEMDPTVGHRDALSSRRRLLQDQTKIYLALRGNPLCEKSWRARVATVGRDDARACRETDPPCKAEVTSALTRVWCGVPWGRLFALMEATPDRDLPRTSEINGLCEVCG